MEDDASLSAEVLSGYAADAALESRASAASSSVRAIAAVLVGDVAVGRSAY